MRILALETSSLTGSVAVFEDGELLGSTPFPPEQRTAQSFAPAIQRQLADAGWVPADIQLIAVTQGPGSFTGLRVGITVAKTLAYAVGAQVIGVNTLQVIAWQIPVEVRAVDVVLDAQRKQLFTARFRHPPDSDREWTEVASTTIMDIDAWLASLQGEIAVTGPGLTRVGERIPAGIRVVDQSLWTPQASTVGRLAWVDYQSGRRDDLWKIAPTYFRKSAAEEKFASKQGRRS